ncbi:caspase-3-like [Denticeps clupeoides]|uniref:caspase-3-like n=1 Tax=Denticeps clupeoides TaxID=299321 RepID=UPI0010A42E08|nr:caspase-3-like [Denticeps clupeoides]
MSFKKGWVNLFPSAWSVSQEDHTEMSCFACVLLSHGGPGTVMGADGVSVTVRSLTSTVTTDLCPSLQGKPKLFFVQACRGTMLDSGVEHDCGESEQDFVGAADIPEEDFLCCYSTSPGYSSWRNPTYGSIFVRELCDVLTRHRRLEITRLLTRVNHQVGTFFQSHTGKRQMPCIISKLTKELYLHTGYF